MKKTLLTLSVFMAVVCCTLAYAATGQGPLALFDNSSVSTTETKSTTVENEGNSLVRTPIHGMQINQDAVHRATSLIAIPEDNMTRKAASSRQSNVEEVIVDLWNTATQIYPINDGGSFDASTNTLSFYGSSESTNQIFTNLNENGNYGWYAIGGQTYQFTGTLTSNSDATVFPCIVYHNGNGLYIINNITVILNEANGYTSDFNVRASGIQDGYPIMVAFLVENSSSETTITSTNNQFYYSYETTIAQEWTSENDLPGLGLNGFSYGTYTVTCADGVTTLGLYYDGSLYVTGINTTATEVALPANITIGETIKQIDYFGYNNKMDWSGAPNLTTLDMSSASRLYASFTGSAITDLFIGTNCDFYTNPSGVEEMYLHIPYGATRSNYTYYGFKRVLVGDEQPNYPIASNSDWVIAGEEDGDYFGISTYNGYYDITEIFTEKESIELPVATPADGGLYYIRYFGNAGSSSSVLCQNASSLKSVTIPQSYSNLCVYWPYSPIVDLHMQGDVPNTNWNLTSNMTVYVGNQSYYTNYENNSSWNRAAIVPEGWEFEWMTVNVGRKGEFAQTYIEMTDADWSVARNVKVTGTLNSTDLGNIKNLTNIHKLDLSEASFDELPEHFLESKSSLQEVILPDCLTSINSYAFRSCSILTTVIAPNVNRVRGYAFENCPKLTTFDLSKVTRIEGYAFQYCEVYNPSQLCPDLNYWESYAFSRSGITEVAIPEGITSIKQGVFENCKKLTKVVLPSSITSIENYAFNYCDQLVEINLPEGLTSIGGNAFYDCKSITNMTIPSTVQSVGSNFILGCSSLLDIKCKAIVPPVANYRFTDDMDLNHCNLYVAPFAIDAYRATQYWSDFYIMKPLNEPVKNIYINRPMSFDLLSQDNAVLQENPNMTLDYDASKSGSQYIGQLSASGDGTLSAGVFSIFHKFEMRQNRNQNDKRTTLVNDAENMRADSVLCSISFEKNRWHFISFQYDVQMSDVFGLNNTDFVIRQYNSANRAMGDGTTSNWETVPSDGVLEAGKGYIIQAANNTTNENGNSHLAVVRFPSRNTVTKNKLFTSNNVIVPLEEFPAEFAHNRSWNLVGNPYPCYYDMHYLMDDFTTPIVLWRGTSYQAYSPLDDDIILRPNEAFFVQRPLDAEQMVFGVEGRMHYSEAMYATEYNNSTPGIYYAPSRHASDNQRSVFNFNIDGCGNNDRTRIVMNEDASMEYEINRDASKFFAELCQGVEIYVDGDVKYDICERPLESGVATLGIRVASEGIYSISLDGRNTEGWSVILTDKKTDSRVDLTKTSYEFEAKPGNESGRFLVSFNAPVNTFVDEISVSENNEVVRIVNVSGIVVYEGVFDNFMKSATPGVYVVVANDEAYKIVIK